MICMTPACTTWCIKWWISGWSYWLNTISSTMITFYLVHVAYAQFSVAVLRFWQFLKVYISQGSAATRFGCGEICDDCFIANFPESMPVKELWKSVENWLSYQYELGVALFGTRCTWMRTPKKKKCLDNTREDYTEMGITVWDASQLAVHRARWRSTVRHNASC